MTPGSRLRFTTAPLRAAVLAVALGIGLLLALPLFAQGGEAPIPPVAGFVNDEAHVFDGPRHAQLEGFLDQVMKKTGVQFAVLTVPTTNGEDPDAYKVRVFKKWGIGNADRDDGLLLLVAMQEHRIVFETGYGLEGTLPDGWQARMLRDVAVPRMRAGQTADAVTAAVLAASQRIAADKQVTLTWDGRELRYDAAGDAPPRQRLPLWLIALVLFLVISSLLRSLGGGRYYRGGGGFYGGGFGGWGGGFGGGSGGGGGSSFGGFDGGGSGGGGGGASW